MKRNLLFLLTFITLTASASERSLTEMQAIAARHFRANACEVKSGHGTKATSLTVSRVLDAEAFAVFEPNSKDAFVIISKSSQTPAVIGYSATPFCEETMPRSLRWFLSVVGRNIHQAEVSGMELPDKGRLQLDLTPVEPFITTNWHQSDPYNLLAPDESPAGCVAVAMAQCINYRRYPGSVNFKGYCYRKGSGSRYTLDSLDIKGIYFYPYLDIYGRASERQKKSVATLIRDCGYATYMQYSKSGSGTYNYLAGSALTTCFSYPEECVKYGERLFFASADDWNDIIYREMLDKSPVIYGGQDEENGGHAFVLCGLDADGLVYVNWGWGGDADGFYDIALMNPPGMQFSDAQDMIYGIRSEKRPSDRVEPRIYSYDAQPYTFSFANETDDEGVSHQTIHITSTAGFYNMSPSTFDGVFGLFGKDLTTGEAWEIKETDSINWPSGTGYFLREPAALFYYYVEDRLIPGHTYRLSFGSRDNREQVWHSILAEGGEVAYDVYFTGDSTTTTFSERKEAYIVDGVKGLNAATSQYKATTRVYDLQGRLIYSRPTKKFNLWDVPARGTLIVKEGDSVRKVVR